MSPFPRFPCGRWLGRNVDDGSIERLLVGELIPLTANDANIVESCRGPPSRPRSPSVSRRSTVGQLQNMLSDAVNSLVKHFHKAEKERGNLTILLCGDGGLVPSLEQVLGFGFKSSRFFSRNLYLWDYLGKMNVDGIFCLRKKMETSMTYFHLSYVFSPSTSILYHQCETEQG